MFVCFIEIQSKKEPEGGTEQEFLVEEQRFRLPRQVWLLKEDRCGWLPLHLGYQEYKCASGRLCR